MLVCVVVHLQGAHAQITDSQHKFLEAALRFYEIAQAPEVGLEEAAMALEKAIVSVVLSPAGTRACQLLSRTLLS